MEDGLRTQKEDDLRNQKEVECYAAGAAAWYNTNFEHDKSLLTLSMASVGLLITPLTMDGIDSIWRLVLHLSAMFSFILCLSSILLIFKKNGDRVVAIITTDAQSPDPLLTKLDKIAIYAFAAGIIFSAAIGVLATFHAYLTNQEKIMTNENSPKSNESKAALSFNFACDLNKSFNLANTLKPAAAQSSSNSTNSTNSTSSSTQSAIPAAAPVANKK